MNTDMNVPKWLPKSKKKNEKKRKWVWNLNFKGNLDKNYKVLGTTIWFYLFAAGVTEKDEWIQETMIAKESDDIMPSPMASC